jgi:cytoskeletal protein RodZ
MFFLARSKKCYNRENKNKKEDLMETLEQTPVEEMKPDKKDKTSKKLFNWKIDAPLLAVLAVLLILAGFGYWKYYFSQAKSKNTESASTESTTETTSQSEPIDESESTTTPSTETSTPATNSNTPSANKSSGTSSNSGGSSTPTTPASPATPTPVVFAVTALSAKSDHTSVCSNENTLVSFTGDITTNKAGTVHYNWQRSDGASTGDQTLAFNSAGTKQVTTSWTLFAPPITQVPWILRPFVGTTYAVAVGQTLWEQLNITSPNAVNSGHVSFSYAPCYQ